LGPCDVAASTVVSYAVPYDLRSRRSRLVQGAESPGEPGVEPLVKKRVQFDKKYGNVTLVVARPARRITKVAPVAVDPVPMSEIDETIRIINHPIDEFVCTNVNDLQAREDVVEQFGTWKEIVAELATYVV
jgi:hypothetical protein